MFSFVRLVDERRRLDLGYGVGGRKLLPVSSIITRIAFANSTRCNDGSRIVCDEVVCWVFAGMISGRASGAGSLPKIRPNVHSSIYDDDSLFHVQNIY